MGSCDRDPAGLRKKSRSLWRSLPTSGYGENVMSRIHNWFASATFAAVGVLMIAAAPTTASPRDKYACMTDDGYGCLRSCSAA
jgi:hypothetical protein